VQIAQLGGNNAGQSALSDVSAKFQPTVACLSTAWTTDGRCLNKRQRARWEHTYSCDKSVSLPISVGMSPVMPGSAHMIIVFRDVKLPIVVGMGPVGNEGT
jgi:hypothetical protein